MGNMVRRHVDHIKKRSFPQLDKPSDVTGDNTVGLSFESSTVPSNIEEDNSPPTPPSPNPNGGCATRKSSRISRPPERLLNPVSH